MSLTSSPKLVKGGLVVLDVVSGAAKRTIALQYNPDTLTRGFQVQGAGGDGAAERAQPFGLKGPAIESIKLEAEIDATDSLEHSDQNANAVAFGITPQLAALESLVSATAKELGVKLVTMVDHKFRIVFLEKNFFRHSTKENYQAPKGWDVNRDQFPQLTQTAEGRHCADGPGDSLVRRIIALEYSPDSISRTLKVQGVGGESGDHSEGLRLKGSPVETIKIKAEIDAIDERHLLQACVTTELTRLLNNRGLAPNLVKGVALPRLSTSGIRLTGNNPMQLGRQLPQSVNGAIGHE